MSTNRTFPTPDVADAVLIWRPIVNDDGVVDRYTASTPAYTWTIHRRLDVPLARHWAVTRDPAVTGEHYFSALYTATQWAEERTSGKTRYTEANAVPPVFSTRHALAEHAVKWLEHRKLPGYPVNILTALFHDGLITLTKAGEDAATQWRQERAQHD